MSQCNFTPKGFVPSTEEAKRNAVMAINQFINDHEGEIPDQNRIKNVRNRLRSMFEHSLLISEDNLDVNGHYNYAVLTREIDGLLESFENLIIK